MLSDEAIEWFWYYVTLPIVAVIYIPVCVIMVVAGAFEYARSGLEDAVSAIYGNSHAPQ